MAVDEFDISDEERDRRQDEADLISRLILAGTGEAPLSQAEIDRVLGL